MVVVFIRNVFLILVVYFLCTQVRVNAGVEEQEGFLIGIGGGTNSEIYFQEEVDYVLCGVGRSGWTHLDKAFTTIPTVHACLESIRPLILNEIDLKPLLFHIRPLNETEFYGYLQQISVHLSTYGRANTGPIIRKQEPIFTLELPPPNGNLNKFDLDTSKAPCFPLTSLVFLTNRNRSTEEFWELYCTDEDFMFQKVDPPLPELPLRLADLRNILARRQDLNGCDLRVLAKIVPETEGEVQLSVEDGVNTFSGGLSVEFLRNLQYGLNFTIVPVNGEECMKQAPDGSLTGIGRQIVNGEADLSLTLSTFESYRLRWLSFLQPTSSPHLYAFFLQPPRGMFRNIFVEPICKWIWLCLGCTWVGVMLAAWLMLKFNPKPETGICTEEIFIWATGAFCQQSWIRIPSTASMRILFMVTFLTSMTIFIAYSASIVSLGLYSQEKPVETFEDLNYFGYQLTGRFSQRHNFTRHFAPAEEIEYAFHHGRDYLDHDHTPLLEDAFHNDETETIHKLLTTHGPHEHYAHTEMMSRFYSQLKHLNYTDEQYCDLDRIEITTELYHVGMFIRKRSPLQEFINYRLMFSIERGIEDRLMFMFMRLNVPYCGRDRFIDGEEIPTKKEFSMLDASMVFRILFGGMLGSTVIMFMEYYYVNHVKNFSVDNVFDVQY